MKARICDVCLTEKKIRLSKWKTKWKSSGLTLELCDEHKDWRGTPEAALALIGKASCEYIKNDWK